MNVEPITPYVTNIAFVVFFTSLLVSSIQQGNVIKVAIFSPIVAIAWAMVALWFAEKYFGYTPN